MNFMKILQSLDDLLFEVMSWLVFFPLTVWRSLTQPLRTMDYADRQLNEAQDDQYQDSLSPPLFLLLALLLSHAIELAVAGSPANTIIDRQTGLAALITDESSLLMLRLAIFSLIPLMLAVAQVTGTGTRLTRSELRAPFYAQCYPAAPFALAVGVGGTVVASLARPLLGGAIVVAALLSYFMLQVAWFRKRLGAGYLHALARVTAGFMIGLVLAIGISKLLVG